jgi:hypothetical protein
MLGCYERKAETKVRAVPIRQLGAPGQATEDLDPLSVIPHELERDEPLPSQQIQSGDQCLARGDQLGSRRRRPHRHRLGSPIEDDSAHSQPSSYVSGLGLIPGFGRYGWLGLRRPRLLLGNEKLKYGLGWNALQGSVEQKEPVEDCFAKSEIRLLEPVLTLAIELLFHMSVRQNRQDRHGNEGATHE